MSKKIISAILTSIYIIGFLLIIGCAPTSKATAPVYFARTITIPLKSSPEGARVILDGRERGVTPLNLKITYLFSKSASHESEIRNRTLRIEKEGYKPYVLVFSFKDKQHEKIPDLIKLSPGVSKLFSDIGLKGIIIKKITAGGPGEKVLDLSPDKKWLLIEKFTTGKTGAKNHVLQKLELASGKKNIITPETIDSRQGRWMPDMSSIIFVTNKFGLYSIVRLMGTERETKVQFITQPSLGSAWFPSISPDGGNIVFSIMDQNGDFNISIVKIDGSNLQVYGKGLQPNWSPDGKSIVFIKRQGDYDQIFKMDSLTGANLMKLSSMDTNDFSPKFSPSGNYIAFISDRADGRNHVFVMLSNGKNVTQLTDGFFNVGSIVWGKDGYIYFSANTDGNWDIWRLTPNVK